MSEKLKRRLLIVAGTVFTGIGIIGIFVPILPTTPFLLLAAACYIRGSKMFYNWLLNNRFLGLYIKNYIERKGIPLRIKVLTITLLWITIGFSITFAVHNWVIKAILLLIAIGVSIHIIFIRTTKYEAN